MARRPGQPIPSPLRMAAVISTFTHWEIRSNSARGISAEGVSGPYTVVISVIVGGDDAAIPAALDDASITVTTLLGGALIQFGNGSDPVTTQVQIYRSTEPLLDREADAVGDPVGVAPQQSFSATLGDTTRSNLLAHPEFDDVSWAASAGWSIASGAATHIPGLADTLSQSITATAGRWYRVGFWIDGGAAGSVTPWLTGGSDRPGDTASTPGLLRSRIQAVTGNNVLEFRVTPAFDGSVSGAVAYPETKSKTSSGSAMVRITG